jgi:D-aminopeptidase
MTQPKRCRARDLGIAIGTYATGRFNAITDVAGVRVGHVTLIRGEGGPLRIGEGPVRTGVTAILPPGENWFEQPVEAGQFTLNGAGTTCGLSMIDEFGLVNTPIMLTNTLSVGAVYEGVIQYMVDRLFRPQGRVPWVSPTVGETADGYLNDIGGLHVRPEHAVQAIDEARTGSVAEGNVGAGTGTGAFGFKGGIGTSSRVVEIAGQQATIGVLVQTNFGGKLTVCGVPMPDLKASAATVADQGSSIMMIVATDLPLDARQLQRLARRAIFGLARTGADGAHGSGDYVIAFSTTRRQRQNGSEIQKALERAEGLIDTAFCAVADATEEAILNAIFMAETMCGRDGNVREAVPIDRVMEILRTSGVTLV